MRLQSSSRANPSPFVQPLSKPWDFFLPSRTCFDGLGVNEKGYLTKYSAQAHNPYQT